MVLCLVYGGSSLESDVSEVTYKKVSSLLNDSFTCLGVYQDKNNNFYYENKKISFHNNGKNYFKSKFKKYYFDYLLLLNHGKNVEDGTLYAYFKTLNINVINQGIFESALIQNKEFCKHVFSALSIPQVKFSFIKYHDYLKDDFDINKYIDNLNFPLIIKPNELGSSIGVIKVNNLNELIKGLNSSFNYDNTLIIEEAIQPLKEVNIALLGYKDNIIISELETVSEKNDVLSYFDKYLKTKDKVTRIIPADISLTNKNRICEIAIDTFKKLNCFGLIRFDFLVNEKENKIYLNELNSIPGSLAYYLFQSKNYSLTKIINLWINLYKEKEKDEARLTKEYHQGNKEDLLSKE